MSTMEIVPLSGFTVKVGDIDHFSFDGIRINRVLFANIRSIHGEIGGVQFNKEMLSKPIMDFLTSVTNVELINILSRELNHFNYFEVYNHSNEELKLSAELSKDELPVMTGGCTSELSSSKIIELKLSNELCKDDPPVATGKIFGLYQIKCKQRLSTNLK